MHWNWLNKCQSLKSMVNVPFAMGVVAPSVIPLNTLVWLVPVPLNLANIVHSNTQRKLDHPPRRINKPIHCKSIKKREQTTTIKEKEESRINVVPYSKHSSEMIASAERHILKLQKYPISIDTMIHFYYLLLHPHQRSVGDSLDAGFTQSLQSIGFVFSIIARIKEPLRLSFAGQNVCSNTIQKVSIVGHYQCTSSKVQQSFFQTAQYFDIQIIGGFVQYNHIRSRLKNFGQLQTVAFTTGQIPYFGLLLCTFESEPRQIRTRWDALRPQFQFVQSLRNFFKHSLFVIQFISFLSDGNRFYRITNLD